MPVVRISAEYREGGHSHKDYKLVLLCGVNKEHRAMEGEWMGYAKSGALYYPFIFKAADRGEFFYGGDENYTEPTNLAAGPIELGRFFTVFSPERESPVWEATYEIVSLNAYVG